MTTDEPREGGPDATPGPAATPADATAGPDRPGRALSGPVVPGPGIPGAGTPPPGPAPAPDSPQPRPVLPIRGAGTPPPGPVPRAIPQQAGARPGGSAPGGLSEVERAHIGMSGTELADAPPVTESPARRFARRWLRRFATVGATAGAAGVRAGTVSPGSDPGDAGSASPNAAGLAAAGSTRTPPAVAVAVAERTATTDRPTDGSTGTPEGPGPDKTTDNRTSDPTRADSSTTPDTTLDRAAGSKVADDKARRRRKSLPAGRPPGAPPDPWTAFAVTEERAPGRIRRVLGRVGQALIHEYALAIYAALTLAVVLTWPTLRYPLHTVPQDIYDPARQAWQVAWAGHILLTDPAQLWHANAYFPERYSFAFGSSLLGYAPAGMLGTGPGAAILRYNVLFVLAHALLALGGYALVRQLGIGRTGAAVAAVAFAYAPWRLAQAGHLDIVSAGGIPLALAMLARGHGWSMRHGLRPGRRHAGWAAAGWLVAAWQVSLGFSLGVPFAYVLAGIVLVVAVAVPIRRWRKPMAGPALGWRLLVTDGLGSLIFLGIGALIAIPYFRAPDAAASTAEIDFFSPPLRALLIGPAESRIWGGPHAVPRSSLEWPAEMSLLPGFVLYALALAGLVFSVWKLWQRLLLILGLAAAVVLTLGTTFLDGRWSYLPLFGHLPSSFGVRIPGRLMLWVTLLLAILAAGAVAEFVRRAEQLVAQRTPPGPSPWLRLAMLVPLLLVVVESWNATAHPVVPGQPLALRTVTSPMLVLPTAALGDETVMLWSTTRFQPIANGAGGFAARQQAELRQAVATFPDAGSIAYLREAGISAVLLVRSQVTGTPWELSGDIPVDALGIRREDLDDDTVLFRLD